MPPRLWDSRVQAGAAPGDGSGLLRGPPRSSPAAEPEPRGPSGREAVGGQVCAQGGQGEGPRVPGTGDGLPTTRWATFPDPGARTAAGASVPSGPAGSLRGTGRGGVCQDCDQGPTLGCPLPLHTSATRAPGTPRATSTLRRAPCRAGIRARPLPVGGRGLLPTGQQRHERGPWGQPESTRLPEARGADTFSRAKMSGRSSPGRPSRSPRAPSLGVAGPVTRRGPQPPAAGTVPRTDHGHGSPGPSSPARWGHGGAVRHQ